MGKLDKLNIDDQIKHMKAKGITFGAVNPNTNEDKAKIVLSERNYYFRLKSYARNFSKIKNSNGLFLYQDLDFEHLEEFAILDLYFKHLILKLVYPIEHFLKVQLLTDYSEKCTDNNGCNVVKSYLNHSGATPKVNIKGYQENLIAKYTDINNISVDKIPIWALVELLSFGEFERFYRYFYETYYENRNKKLYYNSLWSVRMLRNAVSHNTCLLNTIQHSYAVKSKVGINNGIYNIYLKRITDMKDKKDFENFFTKNTVFHDFFVSLCLFSQIASSKVVESFYDKDAKNFIDNMKGRLPIYSKNTIVSDYFNTIIKMLDKNIFI